MSWFEYGNLTGRKRNLRKGVWLRRRCLPPDILEKTTEYLRVGDVIQWVVVLEIRPKGQVMLEVWSQNISDMAISLQRFNVFNFLVDENPNWICEGDLGRGHKE